MIEHILMVCIANICRSPMAEGLMRQRLLDASVNQIEVQSAGLQALVGYPADPRARALMAELNIDISAHRARQLDEVLIQKTDLILTMEQEQIEALQILNPASRGKVFRLGHWSAADISDPYRKSQEVFEQTLILIQQSVESWVYKLQ